MAKRILHKALIIALLLIFICSGGGAVYLYTTSRQNEAALNELASEVNTFAENSAQTSVADAESLLNSLKVQNADLAAWLTIDGTGVNYPVMYTPSEPQKYLRRGFDGGFSYSGVPFIEANCSLDMAQSGQNLIIYGHNTLDGTQFAPLLNYRDASYCAQHPNIQLVTDSGVYDYKIIAAVEADVSAPAASALYTTNISGNDAFAAWQTALNALRLYDIDANAETPQNAQYVMLSTCTSAVLENSSRFLLIAVRV